MLLENLPLSILIIIIETTKMTYRKFANFLASNPKKCFVTILCFLNDAVSINLKYSITSIEFKLLGLTCNLNIKLQINNV